MEISDVETLRAAGYTLRRPRVGDAEEVARLMAACDMALLGEADVEMASDIIEEWELLDLERDAWLIVAPDGGLAAYVMARDEGSGRINADGYVQPTHWRRGLGGVALQLTEGRAREMMALAPEGARVTLSSAVLQEDVAAQELFARAGYAVARAFWRMVMELAGEPAAPVWPTGIAARTFVVGQDEHAVFEAVQEAFQDHWGHVHNTFERWVQRTRREEFDPTLWLLAVEGDVIAGAALCRYSMGMGWVNTLGVRRPWRKQGLGMALLQEAFRVFYGRGERQVGLGVDAQSLTGATRLYERAGMRPRMRIVVFEKELRPGVELSTRALAAEE